MTEIRTRERSLHLRLTEEEWRLLADNCRKYGLKPQAYILMLVKNITPKECPPADFFEVLKELRYIGISLNQIAAKANSIGFIDTKKYWENATALSGVTGRLKDYMTNQEVGK